MTVRFAWSWPRPLLASLLLLVAPLLLAVQPAWAFALPPLPYPPDALEPVIDARTMGLHHDRHHAG